MNPIHNNLLVLKLSDQYLQWDNSEICENNFQLRDREYPVSQHETKTLKSFGLRLRDRYQDWKSLVSIDETDTKTDDTQSQASRPRLKSSLKAKIETDTETKSKHKEEKLSN